MIDTLKLCQYSLTVSLVFFGMSVQAQTDNFLPPNAEAGKCYAKCMIAPKLDTSYVLINTYIGNDPKEQRYIKYSAIVFPPQRVLAEYIDEERREITKEEAKREIAIVRRPKKVKPSNIKVREFEILDGTQSGFAEWREVLCGKKATKSVLSRVVAALNARNYDAGFSSDFGDKARAALKQFQEENGLPIGALDFETLKVLKVKY